MERRAAFDVGSGATKVQIANVDTASGKIRETLFEREVPVKFALDWKKNGRLSEAVMAQGIAALRELIAECARCDARAYAAIATEVFRKAENGLAYLEEVERQLGIVVQVIEQAEEGRLGFLTAAALSSRERSAVIAWDSGGASFQISTELAKGLSDTAPRELAMFAGPLGASVATALLMERVQRSSLREKASPNPVTVDEANELVRVLRLSLEPCAEWLLGSRLVCAIGGPNSLFNLAALVCRAEGLGAPPASAEAAPAAESDVHLAGADGFVVGARPVAIERSAVRGAVLARCGESDAVLEALGYEEVELLVPKLCLLLAVMEHASLDRIDYYPAIGSCAGVLVSERWFSSGRRLRGRSVDETVS